MGYRCDRPAEGGRYVNCCLYGIDAPETPKEIFMSEEIKSLVDRRWKEYGF